MTPGEVAALALRMVVSLALVLGLLVVLARYAARRGIGAGASRGPEITILARRQLGRSASVQVVRVAGETYVLGVGDSGVRVLRRLPAAEGNEEALADAGVQDTTGGAGASRIAADPADVVGAADRAQGALGRALRMVDEIARSEGRHRAQRGDRRRG